MIQITNIANYIDLIDGLAAMKLNQLRAFHEVMLVGSVSEAARNLHRTQSSISTTIASLENDLDMQLFERRNGRLHPVPEAQYLHHECSELLRRLETINQNMHRIKAMEDGEVNIASMPGPIFFLLPELIARHGADHPDVRSTLVSRSSDGVYRLMAAQQYDIGIADYDPVMSAETSLITTSVFRFNCLCALPADDALAEKDVITPMDLSGRVLATLFKEHPTYAETVQVFSQMGCALNVRFLTQYFIPLLTYVEKGLACAIVDPLAAESYRLYKDGNLRVRFRPIEPAIHFNVAVILPAYRPASMIAKYFAAHLKDEFARFSEESGGLAV